MSQLYSAFEDIPVDGRNILFDTNVWISIYGNDPRSNVRHYSNLYSRLLKTSNKIIVGDVIVSEYFNRVYKMEYEAFFEGCKAYGEDFKKNRLNAEFVSHIEALKDTCLNIIDDHEFVTVSSGSAFAHDVVKLAAQGEVDYTDAALISMCRERDFIIVSHDSDFRAAGLDLITANMKVLAGK